MELREPTPEGVVESVVLPGQCNGPAPLLKDLRRLVEGGGQLLCLPRVARDRLIAVTLTAPRDGRASVLASRVGRRPELKPALARNLWRAAHDLRCARRVAIFAANAPAAPLLRRVLARRQVPAVAVSCAGCRSWRRWRAELRRSLDDGASVALVSPPLPDEQSAPVGADLSPLPLEDHMAAGLSDWLIGAYARPKGSVATLLEWARKSGCQATDYPVETETRATAELPPVPVDYGKPLPLLLREPYLLHCTRAPRGPWPGESQRQHVDAVLGGCEPRDALATLKRILDAGRLIASSSAIRGGRPVVCFAERQLDELASCRQYRRHRTRWDFEPYGVCVRRDAAEALGARPVTYGGVEAYSSLSSDEQAFFQLSGGAVDWTPEREWRVPHDVAFSALPSSGCIAFTPTEAEAAQLAARSKCDVVSLERLLQIKNQPA